MILFRIFFFRSKVLPYFFKKKFGKSFLRFFSSAVPPHTSSLQHHCLFNQDQQCCLFWLRQQFLVWKQNKRGFIWPNISSADRSIWPCLQWIINSNGLSSHEYCALMTSDLLYLYYFFICKYSFTYSTFKWSLIFPLHILHI